MDFAAGVVQLEVRSTKNDEGRTFPFDALPALHRLLKRQRARQGAGAGYWSDHPHVFHRDGQPIRYFRRAWMSALERAAHTTRSGVRVVVRPDLVGRIPHDLRRTAVRNLVRAGVPERVAMQLTGTRRAACSTATTS